MADLFAAAEAIKREAQRYVQLVEAAKVLEALGSLEQAEAQARQRTADARRDLAEAQASLADIDARIVVETVEAEAMLVRARSEAEGIVVAAKNDAARMLENAEREAVQTRDAADEYERVIRADAVDLSSKAANALVAAKNTLDEINADINKANAELAEINERIEKARAAARAAFGGENG